MEFDYSKLKGRITEMYDSQTGFAKVMQVSDNHLSSCLCNKTRFSTKAMDRMIELLCIPEEEIGEYFFKLKVR